MTTKLEERLNPPKQPVGRETIHFRAITTNVLGQLYFSELSAIYHGLHQFSQFPDLQKRLNPAEWVALPAGIYLIKTTPRLHSDWLSAKFESIVTGAIDFGIRCNQTIRDLQNSPRAFGTMNTYSTAPGNLRDAASWIGNSFPESAAKFVDEFRKPRRMSHEEAHRSGSSGHYHDPNSDGSNSSLYVRDISRILQLSRKA